MNTPETLDDGGADAGRCVARGGLQEAGPDSTAPTVEGGEVASLPTRTVKPIVSFTPRFTATPLPSATFTRLYSARN